MANLVRKSCFGFGAETLANAGKNYLNYIERMPRLLDDAMLDSVYRDTLSRRMIVGANGSVLKTRRGPISRVVAQVPPSPMIGAAVKRIFANLYIGVELQNNDGEVFGMAVIPLLNIPAGVSGFGIGEIEPEKFYKESGANSVAIVSIGGLGDLYEVQGEFHPLSMISIGTAQGGTIQSSELVDTYSSVNGVYHYSFSINAGTVTHTESWDEEITLSASGPIFNSTIGNGPNYYLIEGYGVTHYLDIPSRYRNQSTRVLDTAAWETPSPGYAWPSLFSINPGDYDPTPWAPGIDIANASGVVGGYAGTDSHSTITTHSIIDALGATFYGNAINSDTTITSGLGWTLNGFLLGAGAWRSYVTQRVTSGERYLHTSRYGTVDSTRHCFQYTRSVFSYRYGFTFPDVCNSDNYTIIGGVPRVNEGVVQFSDIHGISHVSTDTALSDASMSVVVFNGAEYPTVSFNALDGKYVTYPHVNYYSVNGQEFAIYSMVFSSVAGGPEYLEIGSVGLGGHSYVRFGTGEIMPASGGTEFLSDGSIRLLEAR